jgi:hypothetical protein
VAKKKPKKHHSHKYPTKSSTLRRAASGMGVSESPPGSNRTKFNRWFYGYMVRAPWCAIYVCWVLIGAGFKFKKRAGAHELAAALDSRVGWKHISASHIDSGDIVVFHIHHVGICKARLSNGKKRVYEGNHGNKSALVDRSTSTIWYGIRPPYSPERVKKPVPHPDPEDTEYPTQETPPGPLHTAYIVHGNVNFDSGKLTDEQGWADYYPRPAVNSIVYPAPEIGDEYDDCKGDHWVPIKWAGHNGWYRADQLQWAN